MRAPLLIVDDHEDYRRSASALLEAEGFAVVGKAADGAAAIEAVERLRPEVVLLDIQLPDVDGLSAERLADRRDPPSIVLISSREAAAYGSRLDEVPRAGSSRSASFRAQRCRRRREWPACGWRRDQTPLFPTLLL